VRLSYGGHELDEFPEWGTVTAECNADHFPASDKHLGKCPNGLTLSDHSIRSHAVLHLIAAIGRTITIYAKLVIGVKRFKLRLPISTKMMDLQVELCRVTGILLPCQWLMLNGNSLPSDYDGKRGFSISDCNIRDGCTIVVAIRLSRDGERGSDSHLSRL
jgi:hypothetical protein